MIRKNALTTFAALALALTLSSTSLSAANLNATKTNATSTSAAGQSTASTSAAPQIANIYGRQYVSLNGDWHYIVDPMDTGIFSYHQTILGPSSRYFADKSFNDDRTVLVEYDFDAAPTLEVPGDWNTQNDRLYYYEGGLWYRKTVDWTPVEGRRTFLYFGAVNYRSYVALNNEILGIHKGGFTPFNYEVTNIIKEGSNSLVLNVNNVRGESEVPTLNFDWWNYGGITRDVLLVSVPETFIRDYGVSLDNSDRQRINVWIQLDGSKAEQNVNVTIPELQVSWKARTDANGYASFSMKARPELWSPEKPKLYDVVIESETDKVEDRIGFRTIRTDGDRILLNGKPVFLKGVAVHDESIGGNPGRVANAGQARALLEVAKEMNCNFLRLAHYPHNEATIRLAEEMGIMLWEEIPCYWAIDWKDPDTYTNAENQLVDMIARDHNRANVIIWSVANETPRGPERLEFLTKLIAKARECDPTRLVSAAMEKTCLDWQIPLLSVDDELLDYTDIISFNQYVGWYDGNSDRCDKVCWTFPVRKPVVVTEFGGGAVYGNHGPVDERFTEEYLEKLYAKNLEMFSRMPQLAGLCPWVLKDFRSPRRMLNGVQNDFNRKGLVSEKGEKKKAFFVMQDYYRKKK